MALKDLIEVPPIETVIQLMSVEAPDASRANAILQSFVITDDVEAGLGQVLARVAGRDGCGIFLKGNYGSGKSHFLAFLSLVLESEGPRPTAAHPLVREHLAKGGAPCLCVRVALHQHAAARPLEEIVWDAVEKKAKGMGGEPLLLRSASRLIEQFNRYVLPQHADFLGRTRETAEEWAAECRREPGRAAGRIAGFLDTLAESPLRSVYDRESTLARVFEFVEERKLSGVFLFIDELSEFLKSKPAPSAFNEDIRFLQFVGEAFRGKPAWALAALQENIESTGYLEKEMVMRIKDRFPVRLALTAHHVGELIGQRLVKKKPGAQETIRALYRRYAAAFPDAAESAAAFEDVFPVHPRTVAFLEGLTPLFSQHRGVVDFIYHQITGDPNRGWSGMMERPEHELVTPDAILDHFKERIRETPEFVSFADTIYVALVRDIERVFTDERDRRIALKAVKTLILVEISPLERRLSASDLAPLVNEPISDLDVKMNVGFLTDVILDTLVREAEYFHKETAAGKEVYFVSQEKSPQHRLRTRIKERQQRRALTTDDLLSLGQHLTQPGLPLGSFIQAGRRKHRIEWQSTIREGAVVLLKPGELQREAEAAAEALRATETDFHLILVAPDPERRRPADPDAPLAAAGALATGVLVWVPRPFDAEEASFLHMFHAYSAEREQLRQEGKGENRELFSLAGDWVDQNTPRFREIMLDVYLHGRFWSREGSRSFGAGEYFPRFSDLLKGAFTGVLESLFPDHSRVMPLAPIQSYSRDRLFEGFIRAGAVSIEDARAQHLAKDIEAYLSPLGLVRKTADAYHVEIDVEANPLVRDMLEACRGEAPYSLYAFYWSLRKGPWGLTRPFFELVVSVFLSTGRLTAFRAGMAVRFRSMKQLSDGSIDAVGKGDLLSEPAQVALAGFFKEQRPGLVEGAFSLSVQEAMWNGLKQLKNDTETAMAENQGLAGAYGSYPAFRAMEPSVFPDRDLLSAFLESVKTSYPALKGLEGVFGSLGAHGLQRLSRESSKLRGVNVFLQTRFLEYNGQYGYLCDPEMERLSSSEAFPLAGRHRSLKARLAAAPGEPAEGLAGLMQEAAEFRQTYARYYAEQHRAFYAEAPFHERSDLERNPLLQVLRRLYDVEVLRGGADWVDIRQRLAALPSACGRQTEPALLASPRCPCGFMPGQAAPAASGAAVLEKARQGVDDVLRQLNTEYRWMVESYIQGMEESGERSVSAALRRVLVIAREGAERQTETLQRLLTPDVVEEIGQALSGKVLVVRRSLPSLVSVLTGRKMKVGEMRRAFEDWLAGDERPDETVVVHVEREPSLPFDAARYKLLEGAVLEQGERFFEAFWLCAWTFQHRNLGFITWVMDRYRLGRGGLHAVEEALKLPEVHEDRARADLFFRGRKVLDTLVREVCRFPERTNEELAAFVLHEGMFEEVSFAAARELAGRVSPVDPAPRLLAVLGSAADLAPWPHLKALQEGMDILDLLDTIEKTRGKGQAALYIAQGHRLEKRLEPVVEQQGNDGVFPPHFVERLRERARPYVNGLECDRKALAATKGFLPLERLADYIEEWLRPSGGARPVVVLLDALRWDVWRSLKEGAAAALSSHRLDDEAALVAVLPSTTEANRPVVLQAFAGVEEPLFVPGVEAAEIRESIAAALEDLNRVIILNSLIVDELLHTVNDPIGALLVMARARFEASIAPVLRRIPSSRPVVILGDHGFVRTPRGDYRHGGSTLHELLVPMTLWLPDERA